MKFGRKPARHTVRTHHTQQLMALFLNPLGSPPPKSDNWVAAVHNQMGGDNWGMLGNDQYGDCVEADCGHMLMLRTANVGSIVVPTTEDILALYTQVTGFNPADPNTDQGTDETSMCAYMESTGLLGHRSSETGMIDYQNLDHVKWCVQMFGGCRIGFNVPAFAMNHVGPGQVWDIDPTADNSIEGGHDVPIVGYDGDMFTVVTWGHTQLMTKAFYNTFCEEAHAELYQDWIEATGSTPSGFALNELIQGLGSLTGS